MAAGATVKAGWTDSGLAPFSAADASDAAAALGAGFSLSTWFAATVPGLRGTCPSSASAKVAAGKSGMNIAATAVASGSSAIPGTTS